MGYTHYIENTRSLTNVEWEKFQIIVRRILEDNRDIVGNSMGDPIKDLGACIDPAYIAFNGLWEDSYETCYIQRDFIGFGCCKTSRKPYDKLVLACYFAFEEIHGGEIVRSDGAGEDNFGVEAQEILEKAKHSVSNTLLQ